MARKVKQVKSAEHRAQEARAIREQLESLGLPHADLDEAYAALEAFADSGLGWTATYKRRHLGIDILLQLSVQPHVTSFARVRRYERRGPPTIGT